MKTLTRTFGSSILKGRKIPVRYEGFEDADEAVANGVTLDDLVDAYNWHVLGTPSINKARAPYNKAPSKAETNWALDKVLMGDNDELKQRFADAPDRQDVLMELILDERLRTIVPE